MRRRSDPRPHQIAVLAGLLLWGLLALDFEVSLAQAVFGLLGTLLTQLWYSESQGQRFDPVPRRAQDDPKGLVAVDPVNGLD